MVFHVCDHGKHLTMVDHGQFDNHGLINHGQFDNHGLAPDHGQLDNLDHGE